jgi:acyl-CoA synthetase (AMP-forming)/AMP-acid ligase II
MSPFAPPLGDSPATLTEALKRHAQERPSDPAFCFLDRHGKATTELTWSRLRLSAGALAANLRRHDLYARRVAIICPAAVDFVLAISACLLAGAVAVPVPAVSTRRSAERIRAIIAEAQPGAILADSNTIGEPWIAELAADRGMARIRVDASGSEPAEWHGDAPIDLAVPALIQFTSGSTQSPRGVVLTHRNIVANCKAISEAYGLTKQSRGLSWLPLHHDMGLVGHVLAPIWIGCSSAIMNPLHFLQSPLRWLERIGEQRATITSAPNFAFDLCTSALGRSAALELDLSSVETAVCGGEPVWPATYERFIAAFSRFGFRKSAFAPSYGMAEATLLISTGKRLEGPRIYGGPIRTDSSLDDYLGVDKLISVGRPVAGTAVRIVGVDGGNCREGVVGEILIAGDSVGTVLRHDAGVAEPEIRTGDLGFFSDGELYIAGRCKDLIIIRGQNVFPSDIEAAALAADPAVRPGGVAAVGAPVEGTEALVVLFEADVRTRSPGEIAVICRRVNEAVAEATGFAPKRAIPIVPGTLPRTTSGKVQRRQAADSFVRGALRLIGAQASADEPAELGQP